ncbi:MAG TPA: hypothetical protein VNL91_05900 [Thermoanaerobaculia bacterium]|nr:hypothetical protein [Thermoanaerobaculia bacterium]
MRIAAAALAIAVLSCNTAANVDGGWRVEVKTEGGFAGTGVGSIRIDARSAEASDPARRCRQSLPNDDETMLRKSIERANISAWRAEYVRPENRDGYADQIRYTLTVERAGETRATSWHDDSAHLLPPDARALFDRAWKIRDMILQECRTAHGQTHTR